MITASDAFLVHPSLRKHKGVEEIMPLNESRYTFAVDALHLMPIMSHKLKVASEKVKIDGFDMAPSNRLIAVIPKRN